MYVIDRHYVLEQNELKFVKSTKFRTRDGDTFEKPVWEIGVSEIKLASIGEILINCVVCTPQNVNHYSNLLINEKRVDEFMATIGINQIYKNDILEIITSIRKKVVNHSMGQYSKERHCCGA